jgi:hypothetical protein
MILRRKSSTAPVGTQECRRRFIEEIEKFRLSQEHAAPKRRIAHVADMPLHQRLTQHERERLRHTLATHRRRALRILDGGKAL